MVEVTAGKEGIRNSEYNICTFNVNFVIPSGPPRVSITRPSSNRAARWGHRPLRAFNGLLRLRTN